MKDIRQNFAKAVTSGTRSVSGKIVFEFYDELVRIWGGYPSTEPLAFGTDAESAIHEQTASQNATQIPTMQPTGNQPCLDNLETETSSDKGHTNIMKRKVQSQVFKLIDNKRKHLEKTLSSS